MSSDVYPSRPYGRRQYQTNTAIPTNQRFAAAQLAEQQAEAAMRQLRERFDAVESSPRDRRAAGDAIRAAWEVLSSMGFSDFDEIRLVRTEDWPHTSDPSQHALLSLALEIVGWYQFGLRPYDIDRTARIFDRCLELTPQNQRALLRFAVIANTIQPEHIGGLAKNPKKQRETSLGYRLQCKRKIDNILLDVFEITEAHLVGQAPQTLVQQISSRKDSERKFVFEILGHLSRINKAVGDFFGNGTQLSLGMGAACCQLEILGLPRDLTNVVTILRESIEGTNADEVLGEETPIVREILGSIADICESKWRIFKNHAAQRRAVELREYISKISGVTDY